MEEALLGYASGHDIQIRDPLFGMTFACSVEAYLEHGELQLLIFDSA